LKYKKDRTPLDIMRLLPFRQIHSSKALFKNRFSCQALTKRWTSIRIARGTFIYYKKCNSETHRCCWL